MNSKRIIIWNRTPNLLTNTHAAWNVNAENDQRLVSSRATAGTCRWSRINHVGNDGNCGDFTRQNVNFIGFSTELTDPYLVWNTRQNLAIRKNVHCYTKIRIILNTYWWKDFNEITNLVSYTFKWSKWSWLPERTFFSGLWSPVEWQLENFAEDS